MLFVFETTIRGSIAPRAIISKAIRSDLLALHYPCGQIRTRDAPSVTSVKRARRVARGLATRDGEISSRQHPSTSFFAVPTRVVCSYWCCAPAARDVGSLPSPLGDPPAAAATLTRFPGTCVTVHHVNRCAPTWRTLNATRLRVILARAFPFLIIHRTVHSHSEK